MTYEDFLKLVQPNMLDANGRFRGPDAGLNYAAEGLTPREFYDQQTRMVPDPNTRDGYDPGMVQAGDTDLSWRPGPVSSGGFFGMINTPAFWRGLASFGALVGGANLAGLDGVGIADAGIGSSPTLGAEFNAVSTPVVGHTAGVTTTNLAPLGAAAGVTAGSLPSAAGYSTAADSLAASNAVPASGGLLDTVKQWVGDNPTLIKLAGASLGAAASGDTKTSTTSSKDPWAPAQPYLLQNLAQNQAMSDHYNANPFSQEQQNAYQGLLNTVANSQAAGNGLLSMAQNFGQSRRGVMPQFGQLGSAQAPAINWSQYQNIGRK